MRECSNIILVHKGALGDFLQVWPSLYALTTQLPDRQFFWAGKESYTLWTSPLGIDMPAPYLRQSVDKLYSAEHWPKELNDSLLVWFGLHKSPTEKDFENLFFFYGIEEDSYQPPRDIYARQLSKLGIDHRVNWHKAWLNLFGRYKCKKPEQVLIFPGSGNANRCWPLAKFENIAKRISDKGFDPVFVIGPAELERNLQTDNFQQIYPDNLSELQDTILESRMVIGNDSGPLHLAAYMDVPRVAVFGPASSRQWGPPGAYIVKMQTPCSPCSKIGRIGCADPVCVRHIPEEMVMRKIEMIL